MSVREELEKLSKLQELDLKIDRAKKLMSSAPQVFRQIEIELAKEKAQWDTENTKLADFEKQKRQLETEIVMDTDRIKNIESRLGNVTNNKEFHAASKEADKARKLISDRQKTIAELTEKVAVQQKALAEIQGRMDSVQKRLEEKRAEVGGQVGEADKEIASYAGDRQSMVASINPPLMSRYNRIRAVYSDALVAVKSGHCTSCNVALPPQLYIQAQKGLELVTCPNCQRILIYRVQ